MTSVKVIVIAYMDSFQFTTPGGESTMVDARVYSGIVGERPLTLDVFAPTASSRKQLAGTVAMNRHASVGLTR